MLVSAKKLLAEISNEYRGQHKDIMQGIDGEKTHALNVLDWVKKLDPKASTELQLAALFHDIDRIVTPKKGGGFKGDRRSASYLKHKKDHAKRSADYILPRLKELGLNDKILNRTKFLILHHDDTGDEIAVYNDLELNYLVAADTFAFFTSILPTLLAAEGEKRSQDKIRFMVDKIPEDLRARLLELDLQNQKANQLKNQIIQEYYRQHNPTDKLYKYCPDCTTKLNRKSINGRVRPFCPKCGFVFWGNPRLCTSVVLTKNDKILLIQRRQTPLKGFWCLPGGVVEYHEKVEKSLVRETIEETGFTITIETLVGVYQIDNDPRGVGQDIIYSGSIKSGTERISPEHSQIKYFSLNKLPKRIAYKHRQAIGDYFTHTTHYESRSKQK